MNEVDAVGLAAAIITTIYTVFGLPVQVFKNIREKSTAGLSRRMMLMSFCTFTSWVIYGSIKPTPDWYVIVSNFPGAVCTGIILVQFYLFRHTKKTTPSIPHA